MDVGQRIKTEELEKRQKYLAKSSFARRQFMKGRSFASRKNWERVFRRNESGSRGRAKAAAVVEWTRRVS